jgi:multiphosphoryl transfer protein
MTTLLLKSPLAGWCLPLAEVPDPVFAQAMAGDGIAIDPVSNILHAPCDGVIVPMMDAKHAVTIRTHNNHEILMHVGIDTVKLGGASFEMLVYADEHVVAGQPLLRFDLDLIARRASSTVTPIIITSESAILRRAGSGTLSVGDFLMEVDLGAAANVAPTLAGITEVKQFFNIAFDHGLHARPAALVAATLRPFEARVDFVLRDRSANARSTVSMMSLGVHTGDIIEAKAVGHDAEKALAALASLLGAPVDPAGIKPAKPSPQMPAVNVQKHATDLSRIKAVIANRGVAVGEAVQLFQPEVAVKETGAGMAVETAALTSAINTVKAHLDALANSSAGEQKTVLAAHIELIQDPELAASAGLWIKQGKSAGYAWRKASRAVTDTLSAGDDARMMERVADLNDLENQVLQVLNGHSLGRKRALPAEAILLTDELLPSQLITLDPSRIAGICTARGGPTSHISIIASAMGIPALVAAGPSVLEIKDGAPLILNGDDGYLNAVASTDERTTAQQNLKQQKVQQAADIAVAQNTANTRDEVRIHVYANLGALREAAPAAANGAEGCGLLRTEFLFQDRVLPPDENEQTREYQAIASALGTRPLTIRTLDIGGDKPIPYLPLPREDNPALGLRGLRTSLWQPELLRTQLRAILNVQLNVPTRGQCRILLPMVTDMDDVRVVQALLAELCKEMGIDKRPALGVMIETPASALLADQLVREVDFLSVGTNDLSQYTLAMDRGHAALAGKLDALHPAVLRLIEMAADAANAQHKEVAVCGGLASDPIATPILIGLGIHELSVVPTSIPRIKQIIRSLDASACARLAEEALEQTNATAVRALVKNWLKNQPAQNI